MPIRQIAENITQPIVGTRTAKSIPSPMQNARKPISFFLFNKLMMSFLLYYIKKQLYSRNPIIATAAATAKYHRKSGMNLETRKTDSMIHKQPAYLLYVYLIVKSS
jgi:hypothetical protein